MSVPVRYRKPSPLEWQTLAQDIRVDIIRLMGSEKVIPKSYRFTLAHPTVRHAHRLAEEVTHARSIYPTDMPSFEQRRHHLTEAVGCCDVLEDDLALIKRILDGTNLNRFERTIIRLEREKQLLRSRIQSDRKTIEKTEQ